MPEAGVGSGNYRHSSTPLASLPLPPNVQLTDASAKLDEAKTTLEVKTA